MKNLPKRMANVEGTIMIFALFVVLAGALVLAGWVQMLATANVYPDTAAEGMKNRIALENARALTRQYLLTELPSGTNANVSAGLADDWGGFAINFSSGFWTNTNFIAGNPFSPFGDRAFAVTNLATLSNSSQSVVQRFLIKSRSPLLAGYPLVQHLSALPIVGGWAPATNIYYNEAIGFPGSPQVPFTSGTNAAGAGTNGYLGYFVSPMSAISDPGMSGTLATGVTYPTNTFSTTGAVYVPPSYTNGSTITNNYINGRATAVLASAQGSSILRYEVPASLTNKFTFTYLVTNMSTNLSTNVVVTATNLTVTNTTYIWNRQHNRIIGTNYEYATNYTYATNMVWTTNYATNTYVDNYTNSSITKLTIVGSTSTNALHIIVPTNNTTTTNITLSGLNNTRRIYLNNQSATALELQTATTNESYNWWLAATLRSALTVRAPSGSGRSLTITSGFRSDQAINLNSGNLNLVPTPKATGTVMDPIELISDRVLWIEDGRDP
jgi:hypothetical protein